MSRRADIKQRIHAARLRIRQAVERLRARDAGDTGHRTNVAARANIVAATSRGEPGSSQAVTGTQRVRIRQADDQTIETIESTTHTS